ncbi:MAG TPA: serine/threonine-protein kinase [Coleofasciculaceae cyanobacterium]
METLHQPNDIIAQRYRIVAPLGQGAFGTTYEAEDLTNYQRVAIKALSLSQLTDWKSLDLFEREARVLATLNHPAIPKYLDYFHEDTAEDHQFYLVQELVVGESLAALVKKGWHSNEDEVKQIAVQVLEILDYLHRLSPSVIHRDIKPQNIIRRPDGQVFLVDFGAVQDDYRQTLIRGGTFVGTLGYMPPEQFRGQVFFASDLYALGATLLFLLTHRSPADLPQSRMKIDFRSRVQISPEFADWLEKMLEPAAEDRFKSASVALKGFQDKRSHPALSKRPDKKQPLSTGRQPKGSRIILSKTSRRLVVKILPMGWQTEGIEIITTLSLLCFGGPSLIAYALIPEFIRTIMTGQLSLTLIPPLLIFLACWLLGLLALWGVVYAIAGSSYLEIDSSSFRLGWKCLCFGAQVQGKTANIVGIERGSKHTLTIREKKRRDESTSEVTSVEKEWILAWVQKHEFAAGVTPVEKDWLVAEVSDFLERLSSQKD